jgi:hypothetical protein
MSEEYKYDQSELRARIHFFNEACLAIKAKLDAKGIVYAYDFKPALNVESGAEFDTEMRQRGHFSLMLDRLAGQSAPQSIAQTPAPQQSSPAQQKTGPLSAIEIDALQTSEKVFYGKGKLTAQECRHRIATRQAKALNKLSKQESPTPDSKLTTTQRVLQAKGLPTDTVISISSTLEEIED